MRLLLSTLFVVLFCSTLSFASISHDSARFDLPSSFPDIYSFGAAISIAHDDFLIALVNPSAPKGYYSSLIAFDKDTDKKPLANVTLGQNCATGTIVLTANAKPFGFVVICNEHTGNAVFVQATYNPDLGESAFSLGSPYSHPTTYSYTNTYFCPEKQTVFVAATDYSSKKPQVLAYDVQNNVVNVVCILDVAEGKRVWFDQGLYIHPSLEYVVAAWDSGAPGSANGLWAFPLGSSLASPSAIWNNPYNYMSAPLLNGKAYADRTIQTGAILRDDSTPGYKDNVNWVNFDFNGFNAFAQYNDSDSYTNGGKHVWTQIDTSGSTDCAYVVTNDGSERSNLRLNQIKFATSQVIALQKLDSVVFSGPPTFTAMSTKGDKVYIGRGDSIDRYDVQCKPNKKH